MDVSDLYRDGYTPEDIPEGTKWRIQAMREWLTEQERNGLAPIISDKVKVNIEGGCISCGGFIDEKEDDRYDYERVHKMNVCHYCVAARKTVSNEIWENYKARRGV